MTASNQPPVAPQDPKKEKGPDLPPVKEIAREQEKTQEDEQKHPGEPKESEKFGKRKEEKVKKTEQEVEKEETLKKIQEILAQFNNEESNIPINNEYWGLLNRFRAL